MPRRRFDDSSLAAVTRWRELRRSAAVGSFHFLRNSRTLAARECDRVAEICDLLMATSVTRPPTRPTAAHLDPRTLALALLLACLPAPAAAQQPQAREAVVAQKVKLLEQLLASPRARELADSGDAAARSAIERATTLLDDARAAVRSGQTVLAETAADEALRIASSAARSRGRPALDAGAQQARNAELKADIANYRQALKETLGGGEGAPPALALATLDRLVGEADARAAAGQHVDANKTLTEAYRFVVLALSELRAGQTVTLQLKFETPADEYAYEERRFRNHEQLVELALAERRPSETARVVIDRSVDAAARARARAAQLAAAGELPRAITALEEATSHLLSALQAAGMPVLR